MSIEEAAKRVLLLQLTYVLPEEVSSYRDEIARLAPRLAEWVEKALPAMQAMVEAYGVEFFGNKWRTDPTHPVACGAPDDDSMDRAWVALRDIVDPSSLAAEGTTE